MIADGAIPKPLDAHAVQQLYAALLAREAGMGVTATQEEDRVVLGDGEVMGGAGAGQIDRHVVNELPGGGDHPVGHVGRLVPVPEPDQVTGPGVDLRVG